MSTLKIGQILELKQDVETESYFSEKKTTYPKGTKIQVSSDGNVIYPDGCIQRVNDNSEINGYDHNGIAKRIFKYLGSAMPLQDIIYDYDITRKEIEDAIEEALEDILV